MKKRIVAMFLAVCFIVTLLPTAAFAAGEDEELTITSFQSGDLGAAIDAALGEGGGRNAVTSLTVSGGELKAADWEVMKNMTGIVSLDLSGTTCENNEIPAGAFFNYNKEDNEHPENGPKINLTTFKFPKDVTTIGFQAFGFCANLKLSGDWLPESVTTISPLAFQYCEGITSVDLSHVKTLGRAAFQAAGLSGQLVLPDNLVLEANKPLNNFYTFDDCKDITSIVIGNNIKSKSTDQTTPISYIGGALFSGTSVTSLTIPGSIEYLGFVGQLNSLTEMTVEEGVKYFGYYVANDVKTACTVVSGNGDAGNLKLPDSIEDFSSGALGSSSPFSGIEYHGSANGVQGMDVFARETPKLKKIDLSGSGTETFSANGKGAKKIDLSNCQSLTSVSISRMDEVDGISPVVDLTGCTALTSLTFGSNTDGSASKKYTLILSEAFNGTLSPAQSNGVTLVTNGGTFDADTEFKTGTPLAAPEKYGFRFDGWYEDADFSGDPVETAETGKTYYAKYTAKNKYEITIVDENGEPLAALEAYEEDKVTLPTTFDSVPGKIVSGWTVVEPEGEDSLTIKNNSFKMPSQNVKLRATLVDKPVDEEPSQTVSGGNDGAATAAAVILGGAAIGAVTYAVGTQIWMETHLPDGVIPTSREQLALMLWNAAGKPQPAETALYADISAEAADTQLAARWCVEQGLMKDYGESFKPGKYTYRWQVIKTWNQMQKMN